MKVTINWLKEFLETDELDPEIIAEKLTMSGTEVSKIEYIYKKFTNIVTGKILEFGSHPDADKLSVCKVSTGDETLNIVCGAKNFKKDDIVVVALVGSTLPNGMKIKRAKLRGVLSEGMMCSEAELGISEDSEGIMILKKDTRPGMAFSKIAGLDDTVLEMEITPNRPDCMSVIGIARELSALLDLGFKDPLSKIGKNINNDADFSIDIKDERLCPRYSAKIFKNIPDADTPLWLKNRLVLCDQRPVNLLVDITNYVMLETGQPMHAFDKDLLSSDKIIVRTAKKGEKLEMIDGSTKTLDHDNLLIADEKGPIAIAGVMGGKETEISENTGEVLLESANFYGPSIMKTSKDLNLRTEASNRYEKKLDPELTILGIKQFEKMLKDITGTTDSSCIYDSYKRPGGANKILFKPATSEKVLGKKIDNLDIENILNKLGFSTEPASNGDIEVGVPSYRAEDIKRDIDLVEEIARIYGFNRFDSIPPKGLQKLGKLTELQKDMRKVRECLANIGLSEVINYTFIGNDLFEKARLSKQDRNNRVEILNPINEDYTYLRTSLLPSLLKNIMDNKKYGFPDLKLFEISKIFVDKKGKRLPIECTMLGVILSGLNFKKSWMKEESHFKYYDLKGLFEYLVEVFSKDSEFELKHAAHDFFHPNISVDIFIGEKNVGLMGKIHPAVLEGFDIEKDTFYLELDLVSFIKQLDKEKSFNKISAYPSIEIDIAITVDRDIENREIVKEIRSLGEDLLKNVRLFDLYTGKQIDEDKKSLAYSLVFRDDTRTLKDKEVEIIVKRIIEGLKRKFSAKLRD